MTALAPYDPYWIEEPTSPDDILGHAAVRAGQPVKVATGEHVANRVVFKQLLQAGAVDFVQIDAAASPGSTRTSRSCCWPPSSAYRSARTPAGSACASWSSTSRCSTTSRSPGSRDDRVIEYVDHLHEHFTDPVVVEQRPLPSPRAHPASRPGCVPESIAAHRYPRRARVAGPPHHARRSTA